MSDERIDAQPPGWKPTSGGFFKRIRTEGERTLGEETHPAYRLTRIHDSFPNALRVVGIMHEKLDLAADRLNSLRQAVILDAFSSQERVAFHDPEPGVNISLKMEEARKGVVRCLITRAGRVEDEGFPQAAWVDLRYVNGNLVSGSFQAESLQGTEEPVRPWSEAFPELINYFRHKGKSRLDSRLWEVGTRYRNTLKSSFTGESSPVVQEAHNLINDWTVQLIDSLPHDDQAEAVSLLSQYAWHNSVMAYLLEEIDNQRVTTIDELKLDKDAFLNRVLADEISVIKDEDPTDYRQILEVQRFGESDFNWREVEIDEKALLERDEEKHKIVNHGVREYGEEVDAQQYRFKVDRSNGTITVICSQGEKPIWVSSFPLFIPHQEIVDDFENLPQDFRGIKDKIDIKFEKAKS